MPALPGYALARAGHSTRASRALAVLALSALAVLAAFALACGRPPARALDRPNLILITVDTLRHDRLGAYGSRIGLTPNIDRLASRGELFTAAFAPVPFTLPSVTAIHTGRYPEESGVLTNNSVLPEDVSTLAEELSARGWACGAVVGNYILRRRCGLDAGFARYDDRFPQRERARSVPERVAASMTDAGLATIDALRAELPERPLFVWLHYQDPHGPYTPPGGLRERYLPVEGAASNGALVLPLGTDDRGIGAIPVYQVLEGRRDAAFYRAGYDGEVRAMDEEVGRLLSGIEARGLGEGSIVAFTADHGEGLGEDNEWFAHGEMLGDAMIRVPLILRVPGRVPHHRFDVASLADLHGTLLRALCGEPAPPIPFRRDLLAPGAESEASMVPLSNALGASVRRIGLIADGRQYVAASLPSGVEERIAPLGEKLALPANEDLALAAQMRQTMRALRDRLVTRRPEAPPELSDEEIERLRSLGYAAPP